LALLVRPFRWPYELRAEKQVAAKQTSCQLKPSRSLALPYAVYELNHSGPGLHAAECGPGQRPPPRGVLATVDGRPQNCHAPRSASPMCSTTLDMRPLTSQIVQTGMCSEIEFRVRRRNRAACMPVAEVFILHAGISGRVCSEASAKDSTNTRRPRPRWRQVQLGRTSRRLKQKARRRLSAVKMHYMRSSTGSPKRGL